MVEERQVVHQHKEVNSVEDMRHGQELPFGEYMA